MRSMFSMCLGNVPTSKIDEGFALAELLYGTLTLLARRIHLRRWDVVVGKVENLGPYLEAGFIVHKGGRQLAACAASVKQLLLDDLLSRIFQGLWEMWWTWRSLISSPATILEVMLELIMYKQTLRTCCSSSGCRAERPEPTWVFVFHRLMPRLTSPGSSHEALHSGRQGAQRALEAIRPRIPYKQAHKTMVTQPVPHATRTPMTGILCHIPALSLLR